MTRLAMAVGILVAMALEAEAGRVVFRVVVLR